MVLKYRRPSWGAFLVLFVLLTLSQAGWGLPCGNLIPFIHKKPVTTVNIPLLEEKVLTFPTLGDGAEEVVSYHRVVEVPFQKDQCASGCSYNSVASYLEAMDSRARTGFTNSASQPQISAAYIQTDQIIKRFKLAILRLKRVPLINGGWINTNLIEALREGVYLESDFPSHNRADTLALIAELNSMLEELNARYPGVQVPSHAAQKATSRAIDLVLSAFGKPSLQSSLYSLEHLKADTVFYSFENSTLKTQHPDRAVGITETIESAQLHSYAEAEIRNTIDAGRPLLTSYIHI